MKPLIQLSILSSLALTNIAFALNPIPGLYGGITAAVSHGPTNYTRNFEGTLPIVNQSFSIPGTVNYNFVGGGGGAVLGYRMQSFRIEGEAFYNYIGTSTMTVGDCTLESPTVQTPTGQCNPIFKNTGLGFNGSSGAFYGMVNGFYDFYINDQDENPLVPYVGLGIGMASVKNSVNFVDTIINQSIGGNVTSHAGAAQLIVGVSYFLDDYAWIGVDFRYLSTGSLNNKTATFHSQDVINFPASQNTSRYSVEAINFNVSASFDNSSDEKN